MTKKTENPDSDFVLEEATIDQLQHAIKSGKITCVEVVQHYIDRVKSFNGVACRLVTEDGQSVPKAEGPVRAECPLQFPTESVPVSDVLPDYENYCGQPLEFGRMEPTASDPEVQSQYGMITFA